MTLILQISNPHFGAERRPAVDALVALAHQLSPELVVLSGDLTERARPEQFAAAAAFVARLGAPRVLAIPGNCDLPLFDLAARVRDPYGRYKAAFGSELEPSFRTRDCLVLGVKTTRRYRHLDGEISRKQRIRVAIELRNASALQLRVVVLHQPVALPYRSREWSVAHCGLDAVRDWAEAGADVILAGHSQVPFVLPLHDAMGPMRNRLWGVNAGSAVSRLVGPGVGNSVNVLHASTDAPRVGVLEQWSYDRPRAAFVQTAEIRLA
jgi:3',5'-cyclic AMP phosphodiesterase CpdA